MSILVGRIPGWTAKRVLISAAMVGCLSLATAGQSDTVAVTTLTPALKQNSGLAATPAMTSLKGVTIGMTADAVLDQLGKPKLSDTTGFLYQLSKHESLQIQLGADQRVNMAAMIYLGEKAAPPEITDVFGPGTTVTPASDGRIYKLVRYPAAGYSVIYSKLVLDEGPMVTVTIQKM